MENLILFSVKLCFPFDLSTQDSGCLAINRWYFLRGNVCSHPVCRRRGGTGGVWTEKMLWVAAGNRNRHSPVFTPIAAAPSMGL